MHMLGTLPPEHKSNWKVSIGALATPTSVPKILPQKCAYVPLFPYVWETALTSHQCYPRVNSKINNHAQFHQVCLETEGSHEIGP